MDDALIDIMAEMKKAKEKFPTWPNDMQHAFDIVQEEIGEAQKDILQFHYEKDKGVTVADIRKECVQSICMLLRFIHSLDSEQYDRRPMVAYQHVQF